MKMLIQTFGLIVALIFISVPVQALRAQEDSPGISFQTFYDQLAGQGTWIQTNQYGYVFQPAVSDPNWRPYTYGHWVDTDQGMMWVSDESFGWATYHYGRWVNLDTYGWVWVPGYTWAPAWVSWRASDDYYGWAPLPPETESGMDYMDTGGWGVGFVIGDDCDALYGIGPGWYNFCPVAFIGDPHCWRHFADRRDNFGIINRTHNITHIRGINDPRGGAFGHVRADGPSLAAMNAHSLTRVQQARLTSASTLGQNGQTRGDSLSVFAPNIDRRTVQNSWPHSVSHNLTSTAVNHGTDVNRSLAVNSSLRPAGPTTDQIRVATQAQSNRSTEAKIASGGVFPSGPVTSFRPNATTGAGGVGAIHNNPVRFNYTRSAPAASAPPTTHYYFNGAGSSGSHYSSGYTPRSSGSHFSGGYSVAHSSGGGYRGGGGYSGGHGGGGHR